MRLPVCFILIYAASVSGCSIIKTGPKSQFTDGRYILVNESRKEVFAFNRRDTITVFPVTNSDGVYKADTGNPVVFGPTDAEKVHSPKVFKQSSFDIDFLTIPFKYRFTSAGMPNQFNTHLNGAVYVGYRTDTYTLHYHRDLLENSTRHFTHKGISFGGFTGLGGTAINPWMTGNTLNIEYDGVVWSKGLAAIIAVNQFTMGLALGWDHLLDKNRKYWIYQGQPWLGFVFGLNLN
ncbi:MAG TPA: hypothetical protein VJ552_12800 [Sediminibacterium sp.]|nr:hypothetical protein [Sediminibacterium sp.]